MLMVTPQCYSVGKSRCDLEIKLQKASVKLFKWFHENGLRANQDKCDFLSSLDVLMNACFMSQFGYCPLVWMNHSGTLNNRINGSHKGALSLVYNDFSSRFPELFEKDKSLTIHHRNLQTLPYEIFKVKVKKNCLLHYSKRKL